MVIGAHRAPYLTDVIMAKSKNVWVIIHCEWMGGSKSPRIDEMIFDIASSLREAEKYIRRGAVMPYSWWKLQAFPVDVSVDGMPSKTLIYTHTGRRVKDPPWNLAKYYYVRYARKEGW